MSYSALISVPFHPPQVNENELTNVQKKRTMPVALACGSVLLVLIGIGITIGVKVSKTMSTTNPFSATTTNNQFESSMTGKNIIVEMIIDFASNLNLVTLSTTHSSTCLLPLHPSYNKVGIAVANLADSNRGDAPQQIPTCMYLDNERYLYVGDAQRGEIMIYPPKNKQEPVSFAEGVGRSIGYTRCLYINHRNNDLYFLETDQKGNYRVQYSSGNGTRSEATVLFTGTYGSYVGMDLDDQLNIYVSESDHHRVIKWLAPNYNEYVVVAGDGLPGSKMTELYSPRGIYLDPSNNDLYVLDSMRIQLWPAGSTIGQTVLESGSFHPIKIKRDCHGNFYILDNGSVRLFGSFLELATLKSEILLGLPRDDPSAQQSSMADFFGNLVDMYLDMENGDLYVLDDTSTQVRKYTNNGV